MVLEDAASSLESSGNTCLPDQRARWPDRPDRQASDRQLRATLQRLQAAIGAVTGAGPPKGVILTGGLSWLPLGSARSPTLWGHAAAGGPNAAARGALLFARGEFRLAPPVERQAVTLTAHRVRDGLLEEVSVILPWTAPFATVPGGALTMDRDELELTVAGRSCTARLRALGQGRAGSVSGLNGGARASSSCVPSPGRARALFRSPTHRAMSGYSGPAAGGTSSNGGPDAALAELGRAITRAADAVVAIPDDDEATAYRCARALDAAFGDLTELLRTVPGIVRLGDPGPRISERLEQRRAELATRRSEASAYRVKLDDLAESDRSLAEVTEEAGRLRARSVSLSVQSGWHRRSLACAPGRRPWKKRSRRSARPTPRRSACGSRRRPSVRRADRAAAGSDRRGGRQAGRGRAEGRQGTHEQRARRDAAAADRAKHENETAQLAAEHSETLPILTAWSQADADLADGLRTAGFGAGGDALHIVATELNGIRQRLADLDNSLRPMLAEHAKAYEDARRVRPL